MLHGGKNDDLKFLIKFDVLFSCCAVALLLLYSGSTGICGEKPSDDSLFLQGPDFLVLYSFCVGSVIGFEMAE